MSFILDLFETTGSSLFVLYETVVGGKKKVSGVKSKGDKNHIGFWSWLFQYSDRKRVTSSEEVEKKVGKGPRRVRKIRVQNLNQRTEKVSSSKIVEDLETAMIERQIAEDEKIAEQASTKIEAGGPGYMVIALQQQLQALQAQLEALQTTNAIMSTTTTTTDAKTPNDVGENVIVEDEEDVPPPVPQRDDGDLEVIEDDFSSTLSIMTPAAPPPPVFKTPFPVKKENEENINKLLVFDQNTTSTSSLNDMIGKSSLKKLKNTGVPRSPGGTPMKSNNASQNSPRQCIASALQSKFASVRIPTTNNTKVVLDENEWEDY